MGNIKLQVGQKLWLKPEHNYRSIKTLPYEVTISKVCKKYFEIEDYRGNFEIETLSIVLRCFKCGIEIKLGEHTVSSEAGTKLLTEVEK